MAGGKVDHYDMGISLARCQRHYRARAGDERHGRKPWMEQVLRDARSMRAMKSAEPWRLTGLAWRAALVARWVMANHNASAIRLLQHPGPLSASGHCSTGPG